MAETYTLLGSLETVQFLGGTQTKDIVQVSAQTEPHGIYFEVPIPRVDYDAATVDAICTVTSANLEPAFEFPGVTDLEWIQTPLQSGYLKAQVIVYVSSDDGSSTGSFTVDFGVAGSGVNTGTVQTQAGKLQAQLNAIAGL